MDHRILILIPARYESSRFPGKPLAMLKNKSMIQRVYENMDVKGHDVCVVTDDERIESHLHDLGCVVKRVDDDVPSGTERIKLCYERFYADKDYDLILNVQGDEPLLSVETVEKLAKFHITSGFEMSTVVCPQEFEMKSFEDPHVVKALYVQESGQCLYFSRAPIPYRRNAESLENWYQHIGLYSFRPQALLDFCSFSTGVLEKTEGLEQLRALENGMKIGAISEKLTLIGVDTPEQIKEVEELIND